MTFSLQQSLVILRRTPSVLKSLLIGLDSQWTHANYGDNTFSPFDVVGHLIQADRSNWMVRLRIILESGESQPFPVFDRYAMYKTDQGKSIDELLHTFAEVRARNLQDLESLNLSPEMLDLRGMHPALGSATARQLLASWVVHDLGHTHQIVKAMAFQYRDEVGPWNQYLAILPAPSPT
jgi:hypothetical protein